MQRRNRKSERGMTLIEALVAILVFTVIFMAALALYQSANKAYLATDAATIQQQNVRFAMDRLVGTIRDAGANYNPTGTSSLADEQIEAAWESAIVVRGDFDNQLETDRVGTYQIVSTGNDEIVAFVLRKPDDADNTETVRFKADLTPTVRDATMDYSSETPAEQGVETASFTAAALNLEDQDDPPYQLVKVTFDESGDPIYEVIADNIFRMSFEYLDADGDAVIEDATNDGFGDDTRAARASVRRIGIRLIGMADRPDMGYTDPTEYDPAEGPETRNYRKFELSERVWPVNLGLKGRSHNSIPALDLNAPASIKACNGHARNFRITWPPSSSAGITRYRLNVTALADATSIPPAGSVDTFYDITGTTLDYEQPDGVARNFTFKVAPLSNIGLAGPYSPSVTLQMFHETGTSIPMQPTNVAAGPSSGAYQMELTWNPPEENTLVLAGGDRCKDSAGVMSASEMPWSKSAVDLTAFRVHRIRAATGVAGFTVDATNRIDSQVRGSGADQIINTPVEPAPFYDRTAAPCTEYYYRLVAADWGGITSAPSDAMTSTARYTVPANTRPAAPASLGANGTVTVTSSNFNVNLDWPDVTRTAGGDLVAVEKYVVERYRKLETDADFFPETEFPVYDSTHNDTAPAVVADSSGVRLEADYRYFVRAQYECAPPDNADYESVQSPAYTMTCAPTDTVSILAPGTGSVVTRPWEAEVPITIHPNGGTGWGRARVKIAGTSYDETLDAPNSGTDYSFPPWDTSGLPEGVYTITAYVMQGACRADALNLEVEVEDTTCGLEVVTNVTGSNPRYRQVTGANAFRELQFKLRNTCTDINITVRGAQLTWGGGPTGTDSARITEFRYGNSSSLGTVSLTNGQAGAFTASRTINANSISSDYFGFVFNLPMRLTPPLTTRTTYDPIRFTVPGVGLMDVGIPAQVAP